MKLHLIIATSIRITLNSNHILRFVRPFPVSLSKRVPKKEQKNQFFLNEVYSGFVIEMDESAN